VVACHPLFVPGQKPTDPPKEVESACRPRLAEELKGRQTIVLLGNVAKQAVLETREPITRVRQGPPRSHPKYPGAEIVATVHPAACLRSSDTFPSLVRDLKKAKDTSAYVKWEAPTFKEFDDAPTAASVLCELLDRSGDFTVDIEVGVDKDTDFTHPSDLLCVGIGFQPNKAVVLGQRALLDEYVKRLLTEFLDTKKIVCHNGKFDLQVLMRLGIIGTPKLYADTMLASYVLDERPGHHGLKGLASEILGAPDYASELGKYVGKGDSYAVIPRPVLYRYNAYDAALTYNLWTHFQRELGSELRAVHDRLVRYSNEMIHVEMDGIAIDQQHLDIISGEFLEKLAVLEQEIAAVVGRAEFNPRSPKQVSEAMKGLGIPHQNTNVDTLQLALERSRQGTDRFEFLNLMMRHRKGAKLYGTYLKGTRKRLNNGRVYPTYLLHGSVTGRLACRNPNVQNVPRESSIRRLFVPGDGNTFVQGDYSQVELRVVACYAEDDYLQEVLSDSNRDIHGEIAEQFYGPGWNKEQRVRAKAIVYGLAYGREAPSIASEYRMPVHEAQKFMQAFFGVIPKTVAWRTSVRDRVFTGGQGLVTHFGRKRRFWLITRDNKRDVEKEALAFLPQSTANDICMSALVDLRRAFGQSTTAPRIRIPVHDSIMVECKQEEAVEVGEEMRKVMSAAAMREFSDYVPFPVDISTGPSWGELKEV
jgi:DNA polymerase-1